MWCLRRRSICRNKLQAVSYKLQANTAEGQKLQAEKATRYKCFIRFQLYSVFAYGLGLIALSMLLSALNSQLSCNLGCK